MKLTKKDFNIIMNVTFKLFINGDNRTERNKLLQGCYKKLIVDMVAKSKQDAVINIIYKIINDDDYSKGCHIEFVGGAKTYYDIYNPNEAIEFAKNDKFVDGRDILEVRPKFNIINKYDYIDFIKSLDMEVAH